MADKSTTPMTESAGIPQLDFTTFPNQIFWLVLVLVLLFLIVNHLAIPRIEGIARSRKSRIEADLEEASRAAAEAAAIRKKTAEVLAAAKSRADEIAAETRAKIRDIQEQENIRVGEEIAALTAASEARINEMYDQAPQQIEAIVASLVPDIVRSILPQESKNSYGKGDSR